MYKEHWFAFFASHSEFRPLFYVAHGCHLACLTCLPKMKRSSSFEFFYRFKNWSSGGPRYMLTFYLQFFVFAIKIMAFHMVSSYFPILLVSLYVNSFYAGQFFRSLSIPYNEGHLYSEKLGRTIYLTKGRKYREIRYILINQN